MTNPVCWFEIYVQDMPRAKAFYEAVLDVKLERLKSPDVELWAFGMDTTTVGAGGKIQRPKMSIGEYGFISPAIDTEGNMFGLHSLK
jgi:predicted enzyme related to lactoylglutathione lyase